METSWKPQPTRNASPEVCIEFRKAIQRPPRGHGKEGVDGSSPSEGFRKCLQISLIPWHLGSCDRLSMCSLMSANSLFCAVAPRDE
jgi:hypothetical protein